MKGWRLIVSESGLFTGFFRRINVIKLLSSGDPSSISKSSVTIFDKSSLFLILKDNGYIYKGGFCKGKKEGKAKVTCEFNDYYYHGLWNDDMKNGYGII